MAGKLNSASSGIVGDEAEEKFADGLPRLRWAGLSEECGVIAVLRIGCDARES